jgi:peptidoglycan/xylan/chitin deacetylase (PgdA/CDA1 family)
MSATETFAEIFKTATRSVSSLDHARIRRDPIQWPNGARVAVTWTVIFELYSDNSGAAKRTLFGARRGVWRLLDLLDFHQVRASFLVSGYAAERFPEAAAEIKRRGHEIAAYGYASERKMSKLSREEEKKDILTALSMLERVTGERPAGWVSPDLLPGEHTLEILAEEGILWNGDFPNDDLPYVVNAGGKPLVIIPYTLESDDNEIYQQGGHPPSVWRDCFVDGLDVLLEEGATHPKMLNASMHAHILGHSLGVKPIDSAIRYAKSRPDVWFATRTEIAQWWLEMQYS